MTILAAEEADGRAATPSLDSGSFIQWPEVEQEIVYVVVPEGFAARRVRPIEENARTYEVRERLGSHGNLDVLKARIQHAALPDPVIRVAFPGSLIPHKHFNGCHPLIMPLIGDHYPGYKILHLDEDAPCDGPLRAKDAHAQ